MIQDPRLDALREAYLDEDLLAFAGPGAEVSAVAVHLAALAPRLRGVLEAGLDRDPEVERAFAAIWPAPPQVTGEMIRRRHYLLDLDLDAEGDLLAEPRLQTALYALFHACPLLFVGYGLDGDELDRILARIRPLAGELPPRRFALIAAATIAPSKEAELAANGVEVILGATPGDLARILDDLARS